MLSAARATSSATFDHPRLRPGRAGEVEEPGDDLFEPDDLLFEHLEVAGPQRRAVRPVAGRLHQQLDRHERVANLVGDARGHLPDPRQLLGPQRGPLGVAQSAQHRRYGQVHALERIDRAGARLAQSSTGVRGLVELFGRGQQLKLAADQRPADRRRDHPPAEQPADRPEQSDRQEPDAQALGQLPVRFAGLRQHALVEPQVLVRRLQDLFEKHVVGQLDDLRI